MTLVGTAIDDRNSFAVFAEDTTHDTIRLHKGEVHKGWSLLSIEWRAATLSQGDRVVTLEFPPPAAAPAEVVALAADSTPRRPRGERRRKTVKVRVE